MPAVRSLEDVAVRISGVVKRFGDVTALDGLDLLVPRGVCFGLLGPNGAGKSTLMSLLTGATVPDAGTIEVLGMALPARSRAVRARSGLVPQLDNLDGEITCRDNLDVFARLYGVAREEPAVSCTAPSWSCSTSRRWAWTRRSVRTSGRRSGPYAGPVPPSC